MTAKTALTFAERAIDEAFPDLLLAMRPVGATAAGNACSPKPKGRQRF